MAISLKVKSDHHELHDSEQTSNFRIENVFLTQQSMKKHPYFDLQIFDNEELSEILDSPVITRKTIHHWPLSCVDKVTTGDEKTWILKSNRHPCDVEGHFYEAVRHPNILRPRHMLHHSPYQNIIYPFQLGKKLTEHRTQPGDSADSLFQRYHRVVDALTQPTLPVYLNVSTEETFTNRIVEMVANMERLVHTHQFHHTTITHLHQLKDILWSPRTLSIALSNTGLVHGDFSADNVFLQQNQDSFLIIDWQRPMIGAKLIDEYMFHSSLGATPSPEASLIGIIFQIDWLVDCAVHWFPEGMKTYDLQIKDFIGQVTNVYQALKPNKTIN